MKLRLQSLLKMEKYRRLQFCGFFVHLQNWLLNSSLYIPNQQCQDTLLKTLKPLQG